MSVEERALAQSLAKHEKIIERGTLVFIEVGNALAAIRDEQLYKLSHKTFEDYVLKRWGFSRPRAYQLIEASEVTRNLYTIVDKTALPPNEAQLREIAKAPKEKQAEVVTKAAERAAAEDRKPTAKDYKEVVAEIVYEDAEPEYEQEPEKPRMTREEQIKAERKKARGYAEYLQRSIDDLNHLKRNASVHPELIKLCGQILKGLERW